MFVNADPATLAGMADFVATHKKQWLTNFRLRLYSREDPLPLPVRAFWCAYGSQGLDAIKQHLKGGPSCIAPAKSGDR